MLKLLSMSKFLELQCFDSETGSLTVFEKHLPGCIKRAFYIHCEAGKVRGGHRHKKTWQAITCLTGSCRIYVNDGKQEIEYFLTSPEQCLILHPEDWHIMDSFSESCILLVLANEFYDASDYIDEPYPFTNISKNANTFS